jgi:hypothetical protein
MKNPVSLRATTESSGGRMGKITIRGAAAVYREDEQVIDPAILRSLDGLVCDEERFTDYIGAAPPEDAVAAALEPGGLLQFSYEEGEELLTAITEYRTLRTLTKEEFDLLVDYTMGQWSDGIGENWTGCSEDYCGYAIMCLTPGDRLRPNYPSVQVFSE